MANTLDSRNDGNSSKGSTLIFFGLVLVALALLATPVLDRVWPAPPLVQRVEITGPIAITSSYGALRVLVEENRTTPSGTDAKRGAH